MVHRLVKVGEILDTMKDIFTSNSSPTQAGKATKDKKNKSKAFIITMKLPVQSMMYPNNPHPNPMEKIWQPH